MPAQIRRTCGHDHHVAGADRYLLLASGAHVALHGLERVHPAYLHLPVGVYVAGHARFLPGGEP
jgi:hypothetical protein